MLYSLLAALILLSIFLLFITAFLAKEKPKPIEESETPALFFPYNLVWSVIILGFAFNIFLYETTSIGIGFALFNICLTVCLGILLNKDKVNWFTISLATLSILLGLSTAFTANGFVQAVNLFTIKLIIIALSFIIINKEFHYEGLWIIQTFIYYIMRVLRNFLYASGLNKLATINKQTIQDTKKTLDAGAVVKIAAITFLVVGSFASILVKADPVFEQLLKDVIDQLWPRFIFTMIAILIFSMYTISQLKVENNHKSQLGFFSYYDLFVPSVAVVALFTFFMTIQFRYLFGSHEYLATYGITYAEYVRKGFQELLTVSFFGCLGVYFLYLKQKTLTNETHTKNLKIVASVLLVLIACLLFSAFERDKIYVETYGLTRVRLIGGIFLAWLFANLINIFVLNINNKFSEKHAGITFYITSILVLISLNSFNIDKYLVNNMKETEKIHKDYFYIALMSEDAVEGWKEGIEENLQKYQQLRERKNNLTPKDKQLLAEIKLFSKVIDNKMVRLYKKYSTDDLRQFGHNNNTRYAKDMRIMETTDSNENKLEFKNTPEKWQNTNQSEKTAYEYIKTQQELFNKTTCLINDIERFQLENNLDLNKEENYLINEQVYSFLSKPFVYAESLSSIKYSQVKDIKNADFAKLSGDYNIYIETSLNANRKANLGEISVYPKSKGCL